MAKILLAENELALREFIALGLGQRAHEVTMAADGGEALDHMRKGTFDLLLTDIDMPIMDGIALSQHAGRERPRMKIVIMSAHEHQLERAKTLALPVARVIAKPFTIAAICAAVDEVLAIAP